MLILKYLKNLIISPTCFDHYFDPLQGARTFLVNHLTLNGHFSGRTAPLTYRCCFFNLFNRYTYWIF